MPLEPLETHGTPYVPPDGPRLPLLERGDPHLDEVEAHIVGVHVKAHHVLEPTPVSRRTLLHEGEAPA